MRSELGVTSQAAAARPPARENPDETPRVFTLAPPPPQKPSPQIDGALTVSLARSLDELRDHRLELEALPGDSLPTHFFYEPILPEPALRSLGARKQLELQLVDPCDPRA